MNSKVDSTTEFSPQPVGTDFTNIPLEAEILNKKKKQPRRILHFSDGILEEYSTDEEDEQAPLPPPVDPRTLTWGPWMWHYLTTAGWTAFNGISIAAYIIVKHIEGSVQNYLADTCGEKLAWFFGITSPKYQSAIDEFYRLKHEEEKEKEQEERRQKELSGLTVVNVDLTSSTGGKGDTISEKQKF